MFRKKTPPPHASRRPPHRLPLCDTPPPRGPRPSRPAGPAPAPGPHGRPLRHPPDPAPALPSRPATRPGVALLPAWHARHARLRARVTSGGVRDAAAVRPGGERRAGEQRRRQQQGRDAGQLPADARRPHAELGRRPERRQRRAVALRPRRQPPARARAQRLRAEPRRREPAGAQGRARQALEPGRGRARRVGGGGDAGNAVAGGGVERWRERREQDAVGDAVEQVAVPAAVVGQRAGAVHLSPYLSGLVWRLIGETVKLVRPGAVCGERPAVAACSEIVACISRNS